MRHPFETASFERPAFPRKTSFALELLDPVTLTRVSRGVTVIAEGLRRKPIVNSSGLFVFLDEDILGLEKVTIDPGALPYGRVELTKSDLKLPPQTPAQKALTTVELAPRLDYPFAGGVTGVRGRLIERRIARPIAVADARVRLSALDEDGVTWLRLPSEARTTPSGDFVALVRLGSGDAAQLDANGAITVRVEARRGSLSPRHSSDLAIPQGRMADPSMLEALILAWDELQL